MELWIESQDKKHLLKVDNIEVVGTAVITRKKDIVGLGYYNEKRALEVKNEIKELLKPKPILQAKSMLNIKAMEDIQKIYDMKVLPSCVDVIEPISTSLVYEMPKE